MNMQSHEWSRIRGDRIRTNISQNTIRQSFPKKFKFKKSIIAVRVFFIEYTIILVERPFVRVVGVRLISVNSVIPGLVEEELTVVNNGPCM
jgi:hypothetical protein